VVGVRAAESAGSRTRSALAVLEPATVPQAASGVFFFLEKALQLPLKYVFSPR